MTEYIYTGHMPNTLASGAPLAPGQCVKMSVRECDAPKNRRMISLELLRVKPMVAEPTVEIDVEVMPELDLDADTKDSEETSPAPAPKAKTKTKKRETS